MQFSLFHRSFSFPPTAPIFANGTIFWRMIAFVRSLAILHAMVFLGGQFSSGGKYYLFSPSPLNA